MKVLHLITSGNPGGIEILCQNIGRLSDWENYFFFLFGGGVIADEMKKEKMNVFVFPNQKINIKKLIILIKFIKKEQIDIINIHNDDIYLQFYFLILHKIFHNIKFVSTIHNCYDNIFYINDSKIKIKLKKMSLQKIFKKSDLSIFVSMAGLNSYLKDFKINKQKSLIIYNGVKIDDNISKFQSKLDLSILYIGRIIHYKGIQLLLESVKTIINQNYNIKLTLVGDGPDFSKSKDYVIQNHLERYIEFKGYDTEKEKYYKDNDIFVYPSICDEIFGISIVEAMNSSLPVIAFYKGGIPEIIDNNKNGFLIKESNSNALAEKIIDIINIKKANKLEYFKINAKKRSKDFDINKTIFALKKAYQNVIEGSYKNE